MLRVANEMIDATLFAKLSEAIKHAAIVRFRNVRFLDGTAPSRNKCHENVDTWVRQNPQDRAVNGWLVSGLVIDRHSVVQGHDGQLFDITPLDYRVGFVRHPGTDNEFWSLPRQVNLALAPLPAISPARPSASTRCRHRSARSRVNLTK
jgi:hypothetical protein